MPCYSVEYILQVTMLLNAFRQDTNLTHEQIIKAMTDMSKRTELRAVFSVSGRLLVIHVRPGDKQ